MTLTEIKTHLRLNQTVDHWDRQLESQLLAAAQLVEHDGSLALTTQTYEVNFAGFPPAKNSGFYLPIRPTQSIESIKYVDPDGILQTMDPTTYYLDVARSEVFAAWGTSWPTAATSYNAVSITQVAGFGDGPENTPYDLKQAIALQVSKWFDDPNMEKVPTSGGVELFDRAYEVILTRYRRPTYP